MTTVQSPESSKPEQAEPSDETATRTKVSFVLVVSEHDEGIAEIVQAYCACIETIGHDAELVIVNNGLGDELNQKLAETLREQKISSQVISLHRSADEATALSQGFQSGDGSIVVTLPPYLQVSLDDIKPLLERVVSRELDCVASWREPRKDKSSGAPWKSRMFNALTRRLTSSELHDLNSSLRVFRREVIEDVQVYGDLYRFVPILAARKGYRVGEQKVTHLEERVKKGDYRLGVYVRRCLDLMSLFFLTKFTSKPLRFFGLVGSTLLAVGILTSIVLIVQWILGSALSDRPLMVFAVVLVVLGLQLFSIGLLGELIIFTHARDLKEYHVERVYETEQSTLPEKTTDGAS